ncbi:DUF4424 family protein [Acinetobacter bereziniae]|uniref:DUF4424 family protein n=1 Tax=Acinetobacter bereziniae TaxID=106648 RepID=UPI001250953B|nr:DUF4424 family protein [Acinetobacter bereziniae]
MKKIIMLSSVFAMTPVFANDSTGYVGTGGIQYLKNKNIAMYSEDLWISKKLIKVDYQFKNLSNQDISETVLFPLPPLDNKGDGDFAHTEQLLKSFKIEVNGKMIIPQMHVRAFMKPLNKGDVDFSAKEIDVTEEFKRCGFSEKDLLNPWTDTYESKFFSSKIYDCKQPKIQKLIQGYTKDQDIYWSGQVIYSWKQSFKANSITQVRHHYQPLLGGSVALYPDEYNQQFCMDDHFKKGLKKAQSEHSPFSALSYILTTGANWAKPIENFKLTIERDPDELVSFCWKGKVKKISPTLFQMVEKNFIPKQDLDVIFVYLRN